MSSNDVCLSSYRHITREFINMKKRVFRTIAQAELHWYTAEAPRKRCGRSYTYASFSTYQKIRVIPSELATIYIHVAENQRF